MTAQVKRIAWTKLPAIEGKLGGCVNCGVRPSTFEPDMHIAVGFGSAELTRDGVTVFAEDPGAEWEESMTGAQAEKLAAKSPNHDWRISLHGPLSGRTYQRHGKDLWVLVEQNQGFA